MANNAIVGISSFFDCADEKIDFGFPLRSAFSVDATFRRAGKYLICKTNTLLVMSGRRAAE